MGINRSFFFDTIRANLFDGSLKQSQVEGLTAILDKWEQESPGNDDRWLAYMLATAHHETGRTMQAVRETFAGSDDQAIRILNKAYTSGVLTWVRRPYWQRDAEGKSWLGRGLVQLTHKDNYRRLGEALGIDLLSDPTKAMDLPVAVDIMFIGMTQGLFTGKSLAHYFSPNKQGSFR